MENTNKPTNLEFEICKAQKKEACPIKLGQPSPNNWYYHSSTKVSKQEQFICQKL